MTDAKVIEECNVCGKRYWHTRDGCPNGPHSWRDNYDFEENEHAQEERYDGYSKRHGESFKEARRACLRRHGWECANCGISDLKHRDTDYLWPPGGGLHIHHIIDSTRFSESENSHDLKNLIPLCDRCHKEETQNGGAI